MQSIKEILNTKEYKPLREGALSERTSFISLSGSHAYGLNIENEDYISDIDIRGIYMHTKEEILTGCMSQEIITFDDTDTVLYPFLKMINLLKNCNPDVIPLLGVRKEHILKLMPEGKMLLDNSDIFLSQRVGNTFGGYAVNLLKNIQLALLVEGNCGEDIVAKQLENTLKKQMQVFAKNYTDLSADECFKVLENKVSKKEDIYITVNLRNYPLKDLAGMYSELHNIEKNFGKLLGRNKKSTPQKLYKQQMHLIRMLTMATEILSGEGVVTYREKDRGFLLDIRSGKYSNDEIMEFVRKKEDELEYAKKHSELPACCNEKAIRDLVYEINLNSI